MKLDALQSPRYRRFWLGSMASVGATQLYFVGMAWLVFELSGSALNLGLLGVAIAIPTIFATLAGGSLADRTDRRQMLLVTSALAGTALAVLALLDAMGLVTVWQVLLIAALLGLISGFEIPARVSLFPTLVRPEQMMSAVALNSILWQSTRMVLPAIGGVLIAIADTALVFVLCAAGFAVMIFVLTSLEIQHPRADSDRARGGLREAAGFIAQQRLFLLLIGLTWITMFFGTSYVQILPVFSQLLGGGERGYGLLLSATGVGSVTGTVLVGRLQQSRYLGRVMLGGAAAAALSLLGFAAVGSYGITMPGAFAAACACAMLTGLFGSTFLITSMTVLQLKVPDALRGRVMGIHSITFSLIALGGLVMGPLAESFSAPIAVTSGALVVFTSVVTVFLGYPSIRRLDGRELLQPPVSN
jgi:MFS family permease